LQAKERLLKSLAAGITPKDIEAQYKDLQDLNKQLTATRDKYKQLFGNSMGNQNQ
jgi:hypothetical protein